MVPTHVSLALTVESRRGFEQLTCHVNMHAHASARCDAGAHILRIIILLAR